MPIPTSTAEPIAAPTNKPSSGGGAKATEKPTAKPTMSPTSAALPTATPGYQLPIITTPPGETTERTPSIEGTGEPGAEITVIVNGEEAGKTTVRPDGTWEFKLLKPLNDGENVITAKQLTLDGYIDFSNYIILTVRIPDTGVADLSMTYGLIMLASAGAFGWTRRKKKSE
jgi:LPXTG-motif cell wall-anchored protein